MRWLPSVRRYPWTSCDPASVDLGEVEGNSVVISWRRWQLEICIGRRVS